MRWRCGALNVADTKELVYPVCALAVWITLAFRLRDLIKRGPDAAAVALCTALAFGGSAFTISVPPVATWVDGWTGQPNLAAFLIHACTVSYGFTMLMLLEFWAHPFERAMPRTRLIIGGLGIVLAALYLLFVLADVQHRTPQYLLQNTGDPIVAAYGLLYIVALSVGMVACTVLCWRYAWLVPPSWLRRGLRVTAVGTGLSFCYCTTRLFQIVGSQFGASPAVWEAFVPLFAGTGSLVGLVGLTMPTWGPRVSLVRHWVGRYLALRRLYPLWRALYRAFPDIGLDPPRSAVVDWLTIRDLDLRLCRRVIEIRDAQLSLRPWLNPHLAGVAERAGRRRNLRGDDLRAAAEAFQLRAALRDREECPDVTPTQSQADPATLHGVAELEREAIWLARVARFFAGRPLPVRAPDAFAIADPRARATSPDVESAR